MRVLAIAFLLQASLPSRIVGQSSPGVNETDVAQVVDSLLRSYGPVSVTRRVGRIEVQTVCHALPHNGADICYKESHYYEDPKTASEILKATNIRIITVDSLTYGAPSREELPTELIVDDWTYTRCGGGTTQVQAQLLVSAHRSAGVSITKSVKHTVEKAVSLGYKGEKGGFSFDGSLKIGQENSEASTTSLGADTTVQRTGTVTINIGPDSLTIAELRVWPIRLSIPFRTRVLIDADLSQNDRGLKLLSELFPADSSRSFDIQGRLDMTDASGGSIGVFSARLPPRYCSHRAGVISSHARSVLDTLWTK